jgi:hypothetical protein
MRVIVLEGPGTECDALLHSLCKRGYAEGRVPDKPKPSHVFGQTLLPRTFGTVYRHLYLEKYREGYLSNYEKVMLEEAFATEPTIQVVLCLPPYQQAVDTWLGINPHGNYEHFKAQYQFYAQIAPGMWRTAMLFDSTRRSVNAFAQALEVMQ